MDLTEFFQPDVGAYVRYCVGFCVRYFAIAGGLVVALHVWLRRRALAYRIQQRFPAAWEIRHEIGWSMSNTLCTGLSTMLLWYLIQNGHAPMYFEAATYGWPYLLVSALVGIVGFDAWFYWQHRVLHTPWMFRNVHWIHHRVHNPTPLATFAHHPIETFMGNAYFVLLVLILPLHPLALAAVGLHAFAIGIVAHLGYEFYPRGFTRHWLLGWHNTSTFHNLHHTEIDCNYGLCFNYWDRLMGTNSRQYLGTFDEVKERGAAAGV